MDEQARPKTAYAPTESGKVVHLRGGYWRCTACTNVEFREREVMCWECGKGEMVFTRALPPTDGTSRPTNKGQDTQPSKLRSKG